MSSSCNCGSDCKCGSGCNCNSGTVEMNTTGALLISGVAPVKMMYGKSMEMSMEGDGCGCGDDCSCDPCSC